MRRRLVISTFVSAVFLGVAGGNARGDSGAAVIAPVESPVQFVLPPRPPRLTLAERAVKLAREQLGVPYVYGGASPAGFDCSGLVAWVYGRLGVRLPHNSAALFAVGRPISPLSLEPGDIVFFSGLGHVGLYIGHGRMIHAPHSGRTVEVQALSERGGALVGARRVAALS